VDYKGLVRAVTSGVTTTIWAQSQVTYSLDTMSTPAITTLVTHDNYALNTSRDPMQKYNNYTNHTYEGIKVYREDNYIKV
jgi:hypothetical protein